MSAVPSPIPTEVCPCKRSEQLPESTYVQVSRWSAKGGTTTIACRSPLSQHTTSVCRSFSSPTKPAGTGGCCTVLVRPAVPLLRAELSEDGGCSSLRFGEGSARLGCPANFDLVVYTRIKGSISSKSSWFQLWRGLSHTRCGKPAGAVSPLLQIHASAPGCTTDQKNGCTAQTRTYKDFGSNAVQKPVVLLPALVHVKSARVFAPAASYEKNN